MAKAAFITGSAVRIGRGIAIALARRGVDIALHCKTSVAAAGEVADEIRRAGRRCDIFQADLADAAQVRGLVARVHQAMPQLDLLVNNASIFERASLRDTEEDLLDRTMAINLRAPMILCRDFARVVGRGHVVNLLDSKIVRNVTAFSAYYLSKKALADFTMLAAKELAPDIRVNGVCPGLILPPPGESQEYLLRLAEGVPMKRAGTVEEIAAAVVSLVDNEYITGQCIFVDGGDHLR